MQDFAWTFEPNEPGRTEGLNSSGLSHFRGHRFRSLAREMIQNSLDAADDSGKPVKVRISLRNDIEFGQKQLRETFARCAVAAAEREGDDDQQIERGRKELKRKRIPCLVVEDYNTVGLAGRRLGLLVKGDADSYKNQSASLGSRGIGKHAAFSLSLLNTVLYSSQFVDVDTGEVKRAFQGKSSLVSHRDRSNIQRGRTGYYGVRKWEPAVERASTRSRIPRNVRRSEIGTTVIIVGFRSEDWETELTKSIIINFYFAILSKNLEVAIEGGNGATRTINNQTIREIFDTFADPTAPRDPVSIAREHFWCIADPTDPTRFRPRTKSGQLAELGHCKIWIRVGDGLPNRVEVVRNPGMIICDGVEKKFPGLIRLRRYWSHFVAVVVCESETGNNLLKRMEPPLHDDFQPELLDDPNDRRRGESALRELGSKVRGWLDYMMPRPEPDQPQAVDELAEFFPSEDDVKGAGGNDEFDPFGVVKVGRVKERLPVVRRYTPQISQGDADSGDDEYDHEDSNGSNGSRGGARQSDDGKVSIPAKTRVIGVRDVRFAPPEGNNVTVWFTANERMDGASLAVRVGSEERVRDDAVHIVSLRDRDGNPIEQGKIDASSGERVRLDVTTVDPFPPDRSLVVDVSVEATE